MKFSKFQKLSSIIPFYSTLFILIVTMIQLKKNNAPLKLWGRFSLIFFISGLLVSFVDAFLMTGKNPILNVIVAGLILAVSNCALVDLQSESKQQMDEQTQTEQIVSCKKRSAVVKGGIIVGVVLAVVFVLFAFIRLPQSGIEDTNGVQDTSLAVITLDEMLTAPDHYSAWMTSSGSDGGETSVEGNFKRFDYDEFRFRSEKTSGIQTLQATKVAENQLVLSIQSSLEAGNMEIIIIIDGQYHSHVDTNCEQSVILDGVAGKTVVVRMAAESAKTEVSFSRRY